jgi:hypothetical protein
MKKKEEIRKVKKAKEEAKKARLSKTNNIKKPKMSMKASSKKA